MNVWSLKFHDEAIEKAFLDDYFLKSLNRTRYAIAFGIFLFAFFGILDPWLIPGSVHKVWIVRYAVVCPFLAGCFLFTFSPYYPRYQQQAKALVVLICGLAIIAMTLVLPTPAGYQYYAGLILLIMFVYTIVVMAFPYAVAVSWLLVGLYALTTLTLTAIPVEIFFKNIFFLVSTTLVGMSSGYLGESRVRRNFLQTRVIEEKTRGLEKEMAERIDAENALKESEERYRTLAEKRGRELHLSEEKFAKLFHSSPDCMCVSTLSQGRFIEVNEVFEKITGYSRDAVLGRSSLDLNLWPDPEERMKLMNALMKERHVSNMEVHVCNASGETGTMLVAAELIEMSGELCVIMILRDMSEIRKVMRSFHLAVLGEMAAGAAHEMNNPNSVVMLNSSFLLRMWNDIRKILARHAEAGESFSIGEFSFPDACEIMTNMLLGIAESSERMKSIIDNMKSLSKQDRQVHDELVDMNEVTGSAIRLLSNRIKNHTKQFYFNFAAGLPRVKGKAMQLEQTAINIITNALQSLRDVRKTVAVSTFFEDETGRVVLEVRDEGIGIPEGLKGRVFEPFVTSKPDGTGLGLSISYKIVSEHGGTIDISSESEKGTSVKIKLPAADGEV